MNREYGVGKKEKGVFIYQFVDRLEEELDTGTSFGFL